MKKTDRLVGYLKLNDSDCAFEFNDDDFTLSLYPPTTKDYDIHSIFEGVTGFNHKEHKWIENLKLTGVTSSGSNIIFNVQDFPSNYNGFKVYDVNWYFCYYNTLNEKSIEGFRIKGPEIDLFYPPQRALKTNVDFSEENHRIKGMQVSSNDNNDCSHCGKYRLIKGVDANIELSAYATIHTDTAVNPIDANSIMTTWFSTPIDLDVLITAYYNVIRFFEYVTYRNIKEKVVGVYITPGNHDKYRSENNQFLVPAYRAIDNECLTSTKKTPKFDENFYKSFWKYHLDTYSKEHGSGYLELTKEIYKIFGLKDKDIKSKTHISETFGVDTLEINSKKYCFVTLNTAWSCIDDNDNRNIIFGDFQLNKLRTQHRDIITQNIETNSPDLTVVIGHHPLNSFRGTEEDKLFTEMISFDGFDANVYLSGHTHDRTVTNWVNNRHSLNTFVTGIGWPENASGYHVSSDHTYSFYIFNLNANSVDVYVRSTNDGGVFSPDFRIYTNKQDADRKKLVFPIKTENAQTYIPLSVGGDHSSKAYYISNDFMEYIKIYFKKIEQLRTLLGMMLEQEKLDFYDSILDEKECSEEIDGSMYKYLFASVSDNYEIPTDISDFFRKKSNMLFEMLLAFLQKICQKMQQVLVEDICEKTDIVRFHFRYLSDKNSFQYLRLCISFPNDTDIENNDVSEIKYGQLIEQAYQTGNSLIYSVNKQFVDNALNEKWNNFITIVPLFSKNTYTRKYNATKSKKFPFITFGVTTNNDKFDELLYCMDYFSFKDTIGDVIEQYLEIFNIDLDDFCVWLKNTLERGNDDE